MSLYPPENYASDREGELDDDLEPCLVEPEPCSLCGFEVCECDDDSFNCGDYDDEEEPW